MRPADRRESLYAELAHSLATRTTPDGGALKNILESFVQKAADRAKLTGKTVEATIGESLGDIRDMVAGYDFATVIAAYARGWERGRR